MLAVILKQNLIMNFEILENLISEGEYLTKTVQYVPPRHNVIRTYSVYTSTEIEKYENWQASVTRFIKSYHPSDLEDLKEASKKLSDKNHRKILGILKAIKLLPIEPEIKSQIPNPTNNIQITNNQTVSQQVTLNIFFKAIKDELTGKQVKELKEVMKDYESEPEITKTKIIDKIKSFGGDVLSNIVANILTNPTIYGGFI